MELTAVDTVSSQGARDATAAATFGQRYIWDIIKSLEPDNEHLNVSILEEVPAGLDVDAAVRLLRQVWSRHESFRTSFQQEVSGALRQDVRRVVEFPIEVWRARVDPPRSAVSEALSGLFSRRFDVSEHAQARAAIVVHRSRVKWLGLSLSHMVADAWSCALLRRELRELAAGDALRPAEELTHPVDYQRFELSGRGRRANEAAQQYWLRSLRHFPVSYQGEGTRSPERPRYRFVAMRSVAAFAAARAVAARHRVSSATILTALFAELLGSLSRISPVPFLIRTSNRGRRELRESVGHYAQGAPIVVEAPDTGMSELYGRLLRAERHGSFDPVELAERVDQAWPRVAERPALTMTINHIPLLGASPIDHSAARDEPTTQILGGREQENITIYCDAVPRKSSVSLFVDTTYISSDEAAARLLGLHRRLLELHRAG